MLTLWQSLAGPAHATTCVPGTQSCRVCVVLHAFWRLRVPDVIYWVLRSSSVPVPVPWSIVTAPQ